MILARCRETNNVYLIQHYRGEWYYYSTPSSTKRWAKYNDDGWHREVISPKHAYLIKPHRVALIFNPTPIGGSLGL